MANTNGDPLNIRKLPSIDSAIVGGLLPGQRVHVLAWGEDWRAIEAGELRGFVSAEFCIYPEGR